MAKRERNRDRERTRIREEWERENKARADRGEEALPESEIDRQLDEKEQPPLGQDINIDEESRRPEHRDAPPTPDLTPGSGKGESHWNDPENVKNAIHYYQNERPREGEKAAMQAQNQHSQDHQGRQDDAGEIIRQNRPDLAEPGQKAEQTQSHDNNDAGEVIRRNREARAAKDNERQHGQEHDREIEHDR